MSIAPDAALRHLREGNRRFRADPYLGTGALEVARRAEYSRKQQPLAAVLGCSDSRVPVEMVFGQGPGQLFVIRVAGHVVAPTQLGSLEFAVVQLGVRLIVVLGHSGCGAVAATLAGLADTGDASGHLGSITQPISRALADFRGGGDQNALPDLDEAVALNVRQSCADLGRESPALAERLGSGVLRVVGAVYDLESGRVEFIDDASMSAEPVGDVSGDQT